MPESVAQMVERSGSTLGWPTTERSQVQVLPGSPDVHCSIIFELSQPMIMVTKVSQPTTEYKLPVHHRRAKVLPMVILMLKVMDRVLLQGITPAKVSKIPKPPRNHNPKPLKRLSSKSTRLPTRNSYKKF